MNIGETKLNSNLSFIVSFLAMRMRERANYSVIHFSVFFLEYLLWLVGEPFIHQLMHQIMH